MNAALDLTPAPLDLARRVLAAFHLDETHPVEATWLDGLRKHASPPEAWRQWLKAPAPVDYALYQLVARHGLSRAEIIAVALCRAAELDPMVSRVLHCLQYPAGGSLPTLGLVARAAMQLDDADGSDAVAHMTSLHSGAARRLGLIGVIGEHGVLVERALRTPAALALALAGFDADWPEIRLPVPPTVSLGRRIEQDLDQLAQTLDPGSPLLLRSAWPQERFSGAARIVAALGREMAHLPPSLPPGAGVWLSLTRRVPVFSLELAPGESHQFEPIEGYDGPVLIVAGMDGSAAWNHVPVAHLTLSLPSASERTGIWREHGVPAPLAIQLGQRLRLSAARIGAISAAAARLAAQAGRPVFDADDVARASRGGAVMDLGAQAQLLPDEVGEDALVLPPRLRDSLEQLHARCLRRDVLGAGLGIALRTRYRPGVRALLTGSSGTGKTLAASWLATRLGLPLYRVDLSAVVSKYIGETEKNLAQLFARAESAELVLLFDEADALFGKRTDVKDSTDRFANQQTNYLLQRIESFDGIAILTSNSRNRFDAAFTRRFDMVIDFPAPTPDERRSLWLAHLGERHELDAADINRVAAACDFTGGHIRSATLMAASLGDGRIRYDDLRAAIAAEYAKLGRMTPTGL